MTDTADLSTEKPADLRSRSIALAATATCPMWLADFRSRAQRELATAQFPARKSEAWKYTSLHALESTGVLDAASAGNYETLPAGVLPEIDAWRLVFINGRLDSAQSRLPDDASIFVSSLVSLDASAQDTARELLALTESARLPFAALNNAAFADGAFVQVASGRTPAKPLHVVFHATAHAPATTQARLLVSVGQNAALTLVEQYTGNGSTVLTNAVTAIELARDAKLVHVRAQLEDHRQYFVGSLHVRQQAGSRCEAYYLMTGARLKRNDITCEMLGAGAELAIKGAYLAGIDEHVDNQVRIEHARPHGSSDQVFKGIVGGNGRAVFNGRIHIHPGARQTSAELVNNNLLLSAEAEVDTKPELEIYNDDVKCAHGATVGQLNETGVFYLQSRGINKNDAELMLSLGFVNALVDTVPVAGLAAWLRAGFARWFATRSGRGELP